MKKLFSIIIVFVLLLISITGCLTKQNIETTASSKKSQVKRHNVGNMPRGERPTGGQDTGEKYNEELQKKAQDSGLAASVVHNGENSSQNSTQKTITGKVKSIIGNEVVLIITKNSAATGIGNKAEHESTNFVHSELDESESANKEITETYLIPVGMAIGNKDFSSIKAGNTLKLYFGTNQNDGSKFITAVELR